MPKKCDVLQQLRRALFRPLHKKRMGRSSVQLCPEFRIGQPVYIEGELNSLKRSSLVETMSAPSEKLKRPRKCTKRDFDNHFDFLPGNKCCQLWFQACGLHLKWMGSSDSCVGVSGFRWPKHCLLDFLMFLYLWLPRKSFFGNQIANSENAFNTLFMDKK